MINQKLSKKVGIAVLLLLQAGSTSCMENLLNQAIVFISPKRLKPKALLHPSKMKMREELYSQNNLVTFSKFYSKDLIAGTINFSGPHLDFEENNLVHLELKNKTGEKLLEENLKKNIKKIPKVKNFIFASNKEEREKLEKQTEKIINEKLKTIENSIEVSFTQLSEKEDLESLKNNLPKIKKVSEFYTEAKKIVENSKTATTYRDGFIESSEKNIFCTGSILDINDALWKPTPERFYKRNRIPCFLFNINRFSVLPIRNYEKHKESLQLFANVMNQAGMFPNFLTMKKFEEKKEKDKRLDLLIMKQSILQSLYLLLNKL